jgi:hypothetical protein
LQVLGFFRGVSGKYQGMRKNKYLLRKQEIRKKAEKQCKKGGVLAIFG